MKRVLTTVIVLCAAMCMSLPAVSQVSPGMIGVSVTGAALMPASGGYDAQDDLKDAVGAGPAFGVTALYWVTSAFGIEGSFFYGWNAMEDDKKPVPGDDPNLVVPAVMVNGVYSFASLIGDGLKYSPYVTAGAGLYPWKFTEDGISGDAMKNPDRIFNDFSKTSFGINVGGGFEYFVTGRVSLFGQVKYHYVFAEDEDDFGDHFENQGLLDIGGGLSYYFSMK